MGGHVGDLPPCNPEPGASLTLERPLPFQDNEHLLVSFRGVQTHIATRFEPHQAGAQVTARGGFRIELYPLPSFGRVHTKGCFISSLQPQNFRFTPTMPVIPGMG